MSTVVLINGDFSYHRDATNWCIDTFGIDCRELTFGKWYSSGMTPPLTENTKYYVNLRRTYVFKDESDAVMFKLRWS